MTTVSESNIYEILRKIASTCEITEWSHIRETFESIAQNYFGVIIPVTLKGKKNRKDTTLHMVLKLAPTDERYRVSGAVTLMFAREIFVYSELLYKYKDLQKKLPPNAQFEMPTCFFVSKVYCEEVIAMENMCIKGYLPFTQSRFLDLDHVTVALKSIAKFHALSYILKEKDRIMYTKAEGACVPLTKETNNRLITIFICRLERALEKFAGSEYVLLLEILKTNCVYFIESAIYRVRNICISHGDIWKENILFKYEDKVPVSACLIDYQTTRMSSPAFDVLYLIVSSVDAKLRSNCFATLLDVYYDTFSKVLSEAGLLANNIYRKEDFEYDLGIVGPTAFIVANTAIWLSSGLQEEGHIRSKYLPTTEEEKSQAVNEYKMIIKGMFDDLTSYGYFKVTEPFNK